jgi:hypothetical protein
MASPEDLHRRRDELDSSLDSLSRWMLGFTALVVLGVVIEVGPPVVKFFQTWDYHALLEAIGSGLVAVGVGGELFVLFRETTREGMLKKVNADLENIADERIAEAERKTAEAKLETEKLKAQFAWRTLTPDQRTKLRSAISAKSGSIWVEYMNGDVESQYFADQFLRVFAEAKWQVGWRACSGHFVLSEVFLAAPAGGSLQGELFILLYQAFAQAEIDVAVFPGMPTFGNTLQIVTPPPEPAFRLFVGPKKPISA